MHRKYAQDVAYADGRTKAARATVEPCGQLEGMLKEEADPASAKRVLVHDGSDQEMKNGTNRTSWTFSLRQRTLEGISATSMAHLCAFLLSARHFRKLVSLSVPWNSCGIA